MKELGITQSPRPEKFAKPEEEAVKAFLQVRAGDVFIFRSKIEEHDFSGDWIVTRFEMYDDPRNPGAEPHIHLAQHNADPEAGRDEVAKFMSKAVFELLKPEKIGEVKKR